MWPLLSQTNPDPDPCGTSSTSSVLPAVRISIQEFRPTAYLTVGDARRRGGDRDDEGARGRRQQQLVRRLGRPRRGRAGGARGRHAREVSEQVRGEEKRPRTEWAHKGVFIVQPYMGLPNIFTCPRRPVRPTVAHHSCASSGEISAVQPGSRLPPPDHKYPTLAQNPSLHRRLFRRHRVSSLGALARRRRPPSTPTFRAANHCARADLAAPAATCS